MAERPADNMDARKRGNENGHMVGTCADQKKRKDNPSALFAEEINLGKNHSRDQTAGCDYRLASPSRSSLVAPDNE